MWPHVPCGQNHPPVENHWGKATVQMLGDCDWAGAWESVPESSHPRWVTQYARTEKSHPIYSPGCWQHISHSGLWQVSSFQLTECWLSAKDTLGGKIEEKKLLPFPFLVSLSVRWETLTPTKATFSRGKVESHVASSRKWRKKQERVVCALSAHGHLATLTGSAEEAQAFRKYGGSEDKCSRSRWWVLVRSPRK